MEFERETSFTKCKYCKRHVQACLSFPCQEKIYDAKNWIIKEKQPENQFLQQHSKELQIHPLLVENMIRRVHTALVEEYTPEGILVQICVPQTLLTNAHLGRNVEGTTDGVTYIQSILYWDRSTAFIRTLNIMDRIKLGNIRMPRGSTFNVYCNSIEDGCMLLTLSKKPNPVLNYPFDLNYPSLVPRVLPSKPKGSRDVISSKNTTAPPSTRWSDIVKGKISTSATNNTNIDNKYNYEYSRESKVDLKGQKKIIRCIYRYIIIVDFEATCDYSPKPIVTPDTAEIIEFPYVVLDTLSLEFVKSCQMYIRPNNMEGITPYCKVLTSISQQTVQNGYRLQEAIKEFDSFLKTFEPGSFILLTDGVWDISFQLRSEALRKCIQLPTYWSKYFDIREEFRKFLPFFPFGSHDPPLQLMLRALKLNFIGQPHRGIDDCYSIGSLVRALLIAGHKFEHPCEIQSTYNPKEDQSYLRFNSLALENSWKCERCSTKFSDPLCIQNPYRAVWNKPSAIFCRFCSAPCPKTFFELNQCGNCYSVLSPTEVNHNLHPNLCTTCRISQPFILYS